MIQQRMATTPEAEAASEQAVSEAVARVEELLSHARATIHLEDPEATLRELMELHQLLEPFDEEAAYCAELAFLLFLRDRSHILEEADFRRFIVEEIEPPDFDELHWESAEELISVAEVLYGMRYGDEMPPDQVTTYVRDLVRNALRQFEREQQPEMMFDLLERAPVPPAMMDAELMRLRNQLHLYEVRRVARRRRYLYWYLASQVVLVLLVFPFLFVHFENGKIQRNIEEATGVDVPAEPAQVLDFGDAVYWSVITYGSIGYGDITPITRIGKLLAALHGIMGVFTIGVTAGLILNWITPRRLS